MVAKPFSIDTRSFPKKSDAVSYFREMLNRYQAKDRVNDADAPDLLALLKNHTEFAAKVGTGIDHFVVIANQYNTRSFGIVRKDGTRDDFSYLHCITPRPH